MVAVVVFEFSGMRCQPLRRALCELLQNLIIDKNENNTFISGVYGLTIFRRESTVVV